MSEISKLPELHYSIPRQAIVPVDGSDAFVIDCERCDSHELPQAIVRCVNAHDELVAACEQMLAAFEYEGSRTVGVVYHAKERIKAALSKAKE